MKQQEHKEQNKQTKDKEKGQKGSKNGENKKGRDKKPSQNKGQELSKEEAARILRAMEEQEKMAQRKARQGIQKIIQGGVDW